MSSAVGRRLVQKTLEGRGHAGKRSATRDLQRTAKGTACPGSRPPRSRRRALSRVLPGAQATNPQAHSGLRPSTQQEINERNRADYHAHKHENKPEARRAYLKRCFGISPAEYDALLAKQNGACAICRRRSKRRLCVDHCHVTGRIRGLLCHSCNLALGYLRDDQASLVAALAYLGALPRDAAGCAAQRALAVHAVLPPWPTRRAVLTHPPVRFDAAPPAGGKPTNPMRDALDAELARA